VPVASDWEKERGFMGRWGKLVTGVALVISVVAIGSAGVASGAEVSTQKCNISDTGQDLGRDFCVNVTTFSGITASDTNPPPGIDGKHYTWVEFKMTNTGGSTLTNPRITASLTDFCGGTVVCTAGNPPKPVVTSEFVNLPANCAFGASKATITCTYTNIPASNPDVSTPTTKVYFKTGDVPATSSSIDVQGTVKERANDSNPCIAGDPNCDTVATSIVNSYEPDPFAGVSFALDGKQVYLATNDKLSSFVFKSGSGSPFRADFTTTFPTECGTSPSPTCFFRTLNVVATFDGPAIEYNNGPVVFYARLTGLPPGVTDKKVNAIHTYDPVTGLAPRIIGDDPGERSSEKSKEGCTFTFSTAIALPSICAKDVKGVPGAIDVWVWDTKNGQIKLT
jgi:hypothetical protein